MFTASEMIPGDFYFLTGIDTVSPFAGIGIGVVAAVWIGVIWLLKENKAFETVYASVLTAVTLIATVLGFFTVSMSVSTNGAEGLMDRLSSSYDLAALEKETGYRFDKSDKEVTLALENAIKDSAKSEEPKPGSVIVFDENDASVVIVYDISKSQIGLATVDAEGTEKAVPTLTPQDEGTAN